MEDLASPMQTIRDLIKRLLEGEVPGGLVYDVRKRRDWMKYEVVCGENKSFLCVSHEFLAIVDPAEVSSRFRQAGVAKAIRANPKGRFVLTRSGLQEGSCADD
ncbi:MAG: hypothetical protein WBX09_11635 [Terracidiphilus sp.]